MTSCETLTSASADLNRSYHTGMICSSHIYCEVVTYIYLTCWSLTSFSISCSRSLSSLCQRWYSNNSSSLSLISEMLFLRSRVYGFTRLCSLLEDPLMQGVFLWLWGLARGDEEDREPRPDLMPPPGLWLYLPPDSFSSPEIDDGLWAYSALMASALEGPISLWGPCGLSGTGLAMKPCDPGVPLWDM